MMKLLKHHKWKLIISSALILLPMLFGAIVWNKLPEALAIHWGLDSKADGFAHPFYAVFLLPLFFLLMHWLCLFITARDNKDKRQSGKVIGMVFWIMPVISIYSSGIVYAAAFGLELDISAVLGILLGVTFILIGNYLPKCRRNRTIGIKIKWTLANEENWNATHRFGGKVWVICGALSLLIVFLPTDFLSFVFPIILLPAVLLPTVYSYRYHKKQIKEGQAAERDFQEEKRSTKATVLVTALVLVAVIALTVTICLTGNIKYHYPNDDTFTIEASYSEDLNVKYSDIEKIEYMEEVSIGSKLYGLNSPRLSVGSFKNEKFGEYVRYGYTACKAAVVLTDKKGRILVLNRPDEEETQALYEELLARYEKTKGEQT